MTFPTKSFFLPSIAEPKSSQMSPFRFIPPVSAYHIRLLARSISLFICKTSSRHVHRCVCLFACLLVCLVVCLGFTIRTDSLSLPGIRASPSRFSSPPRFLSLPGFIPASGWWGRRGFDRALTSQTLGTKSCFSSPSFFFAGMARKE